MKRAVKGSTLSKRAKNIRLAESMTSTISCYGCEVYHTCQYTNEDGEDFAPHFMLIGEEREVEPREVMLNEDGSEHIMTNIDKAVNLLYAMFNYTECLRFPFENGVTQVALKHIKNED